jgi:imidazolonepropionase-like amidohydrolase
VETTWIRAGRLYDGTGNALASPVIGVAGGRITAVRAGPQAAPEGAPVLDLGEEVTLLPGLTDLHTHVTGARSYAPGEAQLVPPALAVARAIQDLGRLIDAGYTTIRDLGSITALELAEAVADGTVRGPRIIAAGPIISQTGGHGDTHYLPLEEVRRRRGNLIADGPDACRQAVRQALRMGAQVIKICTTGGVGSVNDSPHDTQFTPEETRAMVEEAHRAGRKVASHAQGTAGILQAVEAGVDSIEHGYFLTREVAELMAERGTAYVPTFALYPVYRQAQTEGHGMPPWRLRKQAEVMDAMPQSVALARQAGVTIGTGADFAGIPLREHGANAREIVALVEHGGMTAMEAISAATLSAARILGREADQGSVATGKVADLVGVAGDPAREIRRLLDGVVFVMKDGEVVRRAT